MFRRVATLQWRGYAKCKCVTGWFNFCARACVCLCARARARATRGFLCSCKNQRHCIMNGEADQLQCRRRSLGPNTRRLSLHSFNWALSNVTWLTQREGEAGGNQMRSVCHSFTRKLTSAKLLFALEPVSRSVLKRRPEFCLLVEKGGKEKMLVFQLDCTFLWRVHNLFIQDANKVFMIPGGNTTKLPM